MGTPVEFVEHEACGSSRLQVFLQEDGSYDGYCFSCHTAVKHPYKDKPDGYKPKVKVKTKEDIEAEIQEILEYPTLTLHNRKLNQSSLEHFGVRIGLSTSDGETPTSYHFPYYLGDKLVRWKSGLFELNEKGKKRIWTTGPGKEKVDLFGWAQAITADTRVLYITEGEFDAVALYQMLRKRQKGTDFEHQIPAVVSIPGGSSSALSSITSQADEIRRRFKQVVLVFDQDEAGKKAEEDVLRNFPEFLAATLPCKDANECLIQGHSKQAANAVLFNGSRPKNTRLVWGGDLIQAGRKEAEWGLSYPFPTWTDLTRGLRFGEVVYVGAG